MRAAWAVLALLVVLVPSSRGQQAAGDPPAPTPGEVEAAVQSLEAATHLGETEREEVRALWEEVGAQLELAAGWRARRDEFLQAVRDAPSRLAALRSELDEPLPEPVPDVPAGASLARLEQLLVAAEADRDEARRRADEVDAEQTRRSERRLAVPQLLADARTRLGAAQVDATATLPEGSSPERAAATSALAAARLATLRAEIASYEAELSSYEARGELVLARKSQALRQLDQAERLVAAWTDVVQRRRREEADRAADEARRKQQALRDLVASVPAVRRLVDSNAQLAEELSGPDGVVQRLADFAAVAASIRTELADVDRRVASLKAKQELAGLTEALGVRLVAYRQELRELLRRRGSMPGWGAESADVQFRRLDLVEEAERHLDIDRLVVADLAGLDTDLSAAERDEIERALREQYAVRRDLLRQLTESYESYASDLADADADLSALIARAEAFALDIDEQVLWIPTAKALHDAEGRGPTRWQHVRDALLWLADPSAWAEVVRGLDDVLLARPFRSVLPLLLLVGLYGIRPRLWRRMGRLATAVRHIRTDRLTHTWRALGDTALIAAPLPLAGWYLGWVVERASPHVEHARALASACDVALPGLAVAALLDAVCRPRGLGTVHFRWPESSVRLLRRSVRLLVLVGVVPLAVAQMLAHHGELAWAHSLGRLAFMAGMIVLACFGAAVLRPARGVFGPLIAEHPGGWLARLRWLLLPVGVGLPLALAVLAELGFLYSAQQLLARFVATLYFGVGLGLAHALLMRVLFVGRRQLAFQQFVKRREAARADATGAERTAVMGRPGGSVSGVFEELVEEERIDIPSVSAQSLRLAQTAVAFALVAGLLVIWADVLPAVRGLDRVAVWERVEQVVETQEMADGGSRTQLIPRVVPVTLTDVLMAVVWLAVTVAASRNLPGLLEITVLQHLPLQRAGRYAVTTVARYLIVIIGVVAVFGALGIGWSKVQWLAAAVSVGLGFGLQEIFANFVSGLILLFERPMRVGDTVTVGEVTGTVTRIHMRATTIVTWDRTELVVPNREFITSQLVNWTLSDSVLRVVLNVGIAYGSDIEKAESTLLRILRRHAEVLDDPPPRVIFDAFGDSTLVFELRFYVTSPDLYRRIQHDINKAIDREFRKAGVEIAFPQRDLHIRSSAVPITVVHRDEQVDRRDVVPGVGTGDAAPAKDAT